MGRKQIVVAFGAVSLLSGCGLTPRHHVTRTEVASSVELRDAPENAVLKVGEAMAYADKKGEARLVIPDGSHELTVIFENKVIYRETIFIKDGTRKIVDLRP